MANQSKSSSRRRLAGATLPLLLIGAGMILLGITAFLMLPRPEAGGEEQPRELSAVPVAVNMPAPALRLNNLQGEPVSLADYRGQWILVNNWATWCPPCKAEMPTLQAYFDDHRGQNFTIIAIESGQPVEEVAEFVRAYGLTFNVWPDPDENVYDAFRNISLPASWVIDPLGQIRLTWTGAISREMLEAYVTPLLLKE
jgi:peroxiredoxin